MEIGCGWFTAIKSRLFVLRLSLLILLDFLHRISTNDDLMNRSCLPNKIYLDTNRLSDEGQQSIFLSDPRTGLVVVPAQPLFNGDLYLYSYHPDCLMMDWAIVWTSNSEEVE